MITIRVLRLVIKRSLHKRYSIRKASLWRNTMTFCVSMSSITGTKCTGEGASLKELTKQKRSSLLQSNINQSNLVPFEHLPSASSSWWKKWRRCNSSCFRTFAREFGVYFHQLMGKVNRVFDTNFHYQHSEGGGRLSWMMGVP